jgi:hypothetical protein
MAIGETGRTMEQPLYYNPLRRPVQPSPTFVSVKALIQRINRKLRHDFRSLRKSRGVRMQTSVGEYYLLDTYRNLIVEQRVDPEELGRELEVIAANETVAEP